MLFPSLEGSTYRIVSLDPSSTNLGVVCVEADIGCRFYRVLDARTFYGKDAVRGLGDQKKRHLERFLRNRELAAWFAPYLERFKPYTVCAEQPHLRFLTAFAALTEQIALLQNTVAEYDATMPYYSYKSSPVKKAIGVSGGSQNKEDVRGALAKHPEVSFVNGIKLNNLDEHQCDAIIVALYHAQHMRFPWLDTSLC